MIRLDSDWLDPSVLPRLCCSLGSALLCIFPWPSGWLTSGKIVLVVSGFTSMHLVVGGRDFPSIPNEPEIHLNWVISSHFPPPSPNQWCNQGKWNVPMIALKQPQFLLKFEMGSPFPKVLELMVKDTIQVKVWVLLIMGKPVVNVGYVAKNVHSTIPNAWIKTISDNVSFYKHFLDLLYTVSFMYMCLASLSLL